jgi:hypothetical protein
MEENLEGQKPQDSPPPSDVTDVSKGLGKKEKKGYDDGYYCAYCPNE